MQDLQNETWKEIENSDYYAISDKGRIKRLEHSVWSSWNNSYSTFKEKLLTPNNNNTKGYYRQAVKYIDGTIVIESIHRLVARMFIENDNPMVKNQINHIDGNKSNNCVENLEWCSQSENMRHRIDTLDSKNWRQGETSPLSKLNDKKVIEIVELLNKGVKRSIITKQYNIAKSTISEIVAGRTWKHLNLQFNEGVRTRPIPLTKEQIKDIKESSKDSEYWSEKLNVSKYVIEHMRNSPD